jgi:hypothetical protein
MNAIFGGLLEIQSDEQLEEMVNTMDSALAVKLLEFALENCTDKFTLLENHLIYKCLETIKNNK